MISTKFFGVVCALAIASASCATRTSIFQPSPFPNAPAANWTPATRAVVGPSPLRQDVIQTALALRGVPYRLGGELPETGFDCSGLVRYVFNQYQIAVPRTVAEQFRVGDRIAASAVEAGDLVFFNTTAASPSHVGVAIDATTFIHAPDNGGVVRVERFDTPYWTTRLAGIRRLNY